MGWDERHPDKSDTRRLLMSSIKDLLEITLNRSSHLQMSLVAFPVGSRAFPWSSLLPGAFFTSLTPRGSWHSFQRTRTAQSIAIWWTFREDPLSTLKPVISQQRGIARDKTKAGNPCDPWSRNSLISSNFHTISFSYSSLCSLTVTFFHFIFYFILFKCLFQLLNSRCFSFFSWHSRLCIRQPSWLGKGLLGRWRKTLRSRFLLLELSVMQVLRDCKSMKIKSTDCIIPCIYFFCLKCTCGLVIL